MINYGLAKKLNFNYLNSHPFPHIVIDDFLDKGIAQKASNDLRNYEKWDYDPTEYSDGVQKNKFFSPGIDIDLEYMENDTRTAWQVLQFLNSPITLSFLEELTGIKGLIPDPKFIGGGYHKILRGGKLAVHADYNVHPETKLHRRINLLVYLNQNWQEEWGGHLELWSKDLSHRTHNILPIFNRAVIFNITDDAYHGHPQPLNCPENEARYSLALYYFTEERPDNEKNFEHSALWQFPEENKINNNLDEVFQLTNE
jgi:Rps23 Pro-64 3,4-dihydroxylase Tpa1-like proline 4-hydroxylase